MSIKTHFIISKKLWTKTNAKIILGCQLEMSTQGQSTVNNANTFCFNVKYSLMKLLRTLAHLCEGNPLQPLPLDFYGLTLSCILSHNFSFLLLVIESMQDKVNPCLGDG